MSTDRNSSLDHSDVASSQGEDAGAMKPPADASERAAQPNVEAGSPPEEPQAAGAETTPVSEPRTAEPSESESPPLDDRKVASDEAADEPVAPEGQSSQEAVADKAGADEAGADEADSDEADSDDEDVEPLELLSDDEDSDEDLQQRWYILKVQVNREESIRDALLRRVKIAGLDRYFGDIVVPTEDVAEFTKSGKRRIVKRKLYPGYIMVHMAINDDTWFLVRETPGIGDFTGSAGKPTPMDGNEVDRILNLGAADDDGETQIKTSIPYKPGDRVRVKEGYFQNFEGEVESVDEANGRVTVMINIFGRSTPVELEHWQIESV